MTVTTLLTNRTTLLQHILITAQVPLVCLSNRAETVYICRTVGTWPWHLACYSIVRRPLDAFPLPRKLHYLPHVTTQISVPFISPTHLRKKRDLSSLENTTSHESYHPLSRIEDFIQEMTNAYPQTARSNQHWPECRRSGYFALIISAGLQRGRRGRRKGRSWGGKLRSLVSWFKEPNMHTRYVNPNPIISWLLTALQWIAMATSLYITHALVANTSERHSLTHLLMNFVCLNLLPHKIRIVIVRIFISYLYQIRMDTTTHGRQIIFGTRIRQIISAYNRRIGLDMNRWATSPSPIFFLSHLAKSWQ